MMSRTVALIFILAGLNGLTSVRIQRINMPEIIQLGTQDTIILDCDFVYGNYTLGLVIKWFFQNKSRPVYQWIPTKKPQDLGILRGNIDLSYKASEDPYKMYRAIKIVKPSTDMSGEYTCVVSTFMEEDQKTKRMTIFAPETEFRLIQNKSSDDSVNVICLAEGMYPVPNLTLSMPERLIQSSFHKVEKISGRYSAVTMATIKDDELPTPSEFICTLRIPLANYVVRKETIYYPGPMTTTPEMPTSAGMQLASLSARTIQDIYYSTVLSFGGLIACLNAYYRNG